MSRRQLTSCVVGKFVLCYQNNMQICSFLLLCDKLVLFFHRCTTIVQDSCMLVVIQSTYTSVKFLVITRFISQLTHFSLKYVGVIRSVLRILQLLLIRFTQRNSCCISDSTMKQERNGHDLTQLWLFEVKLIFIIEYCECSQLSVNEVHKS